MLDAAAKLNVLEPAPGEAIEAGDHVAVSPFGRPVTDSVTADLNPPPIVVEICTCAEEPAAMEALGEARLSVKEGTADGAVASDQWCTSIIASGVPIPVA